MKRWYALCALAAAGVAVLSYGLPRLEPRAAAMRSTLDRASAFEATRTAAAAQGIEIGAWRAVHSTDFSSRDTEVRSTLPRTPLRERLEPFIWQVLALGPDGQVIRCDFSAAGALTRLEWRSDRYPPTTSDPAQVAARAFQMLARSDAPQFRPVSAATASAEGLRYVWEWSAGDGSGDLARILVVVKDGRVTLAERKVELGEATMSALGDSRARSVTLAGTLVVLGFAGVLLAVLAVLLPLAVRRDHLWFGLRLAAVPALAVLLNYTSGDLYEEAAASAAVARQSVAGQVAGSAVGWVFLLLFFALLAGGGFAAVTPPHTTRWSGLYLLSRFQLLARPVGAQLCAGLLAGPALAAAPYLIALLRMPGSHFPAVANSDLLIRPAAWLAPAMGFIFNWDLFGLFGLLLPFLAKYVGARWLRAAAVALPALLFTSASRGFFSNILGPDLLSGGVLLLVAWFLYHRFGLLAVFASEVGMRASLAAGQLLMQPNPTQVQRGWVVVAVWLSLAAAAALVAWRGRVPGPRQLAPLFHPRVRTSAGERQRLLAQFAVARRAQENMLPAAPPALAGYSLAAVCRPAREVGGDLYDFPPLAGGRQGIVVADVAGKGVQAALYMTLTKGMLLSASRSHTSLAGLAVTLNHHLYLTGRRRTFVTMVLGALEPETGRLELVRAGHGPVLHYRAADGGVEWLNPAGIGLGLAGDSPFRRALETRTIRLSPGDVAVFYSDGLNEAMNRDQELFGEERLREVVQQHAAAPAVAIRDAILAGVERFTGGAEANDDLTMVVLRVDPPAVH